ncbi:MAG: c-type cytochrome [Verrucomicrobiales bacterium]|nr:c-type cytochrome [Verrucomicrobiales bacterium]
MRTLLPLLSVFATLALFEPVAMAQNGDREGHVMEPPPAHWKIPDAPVTDADKALETFAMEKGFELELVAAEPMIHDPVALAFDGNGRMWVAEMQGYMPDIDAKKEMETYGRISVLEDTDGDGKADKHTVFLEEFLLPRAVALVDGDKSLLFADNLKLYEAEILIAEDGTISAGEVVVVDDTYAEGGNPEHKPNGLMFGLDNWLYNAKSDLRYRKINGQWIKEKTEDRGQWGIKQDNYGRLLTNTNSNLITVEEIPPGLTVRNKAYQFRSNVKSQIKDQAVWPARITPGINRGYMDGMLTEEGRLTKPTAASGMAIYRGDQFPAEYYGNIFVPEPAGNLVKRAVVTEGADGFREIKSALKNAEFLTSTDERSRMVDAYTAPDGSLYLLDFYRGIIQHQTYMTSYLRAQVIERKLDTPIGLGRIWRVRHTAGRELGEQPRMQNEDSVALVGYLSHANGWWRDTAQRIIVERGDRSAVPALKEVVKRAESHLGKIHAIWALEGLGSLDPATVRAALSDSHPRVAAEAIRASESLAGSADHDEMLSLLSSQVDTGNVLVKRQLAASLGLFGEKAVPVIAGMLKQNQDDALLGDLAVSGLSGQELTLFAALPDAHPLRAPLIQTLVTRNEKAELRELIASVQSPAEWKTLARSVVSMRRGTAARELLTISVDTATDEKVRKAVIEGMLSGGKDKKFKPMPVTELTMLDGVDGEQFKELARLFEVGSGEEANFLVTDEHRRQFKEGEVHYQRVCLGCHQIHGNGQQYLAPPLVGSEWVLGSTDRLVALVMDGVEGPIEVLGKTYTAPEIQPLMPGLRLNPEVTDEQLAAILTYVRNAWGNAATPVQADQLTKYRESTEVRAPWPAHELQKMK